jgi:nucleoside-diphosphate-sugar epimerase
MTLARPTRFKRPVLLIVGCGDIGLRVARLLRGRWRLLALTSSRERRDELRRAGIVPLAGNLDDPASLARLAGLADAVLHLAPPPADGAGDPRSRVLGEALARRGRVRRLVYASTTGVYGDCGGARVDETRPVAPATARAARRVDAERRLRLFGRTYGVTVTILRVPGIYALDRAGGDPRVRVARGTPVLEAADDVHTNHIHADDLARACVAALHRGRPQRIVHASDDTELKMGDYFDLVADLAGLARPPRLSRAQAAQLLTPVQMSFLGESRRLDNTRLKRELGVVLRHPDVVSGLAVLRVERPAEPMTDAVATLQDSVLPLRYLAAP